MSTENKSCAPRLRFPGFTGEWKEKKLGEITNDIYQPQTISKEQFTNTGYPVYGANGIIGFYDKYNHETDQILVTCRGASCGTINFSKGKCWITGNAMVVNLDKVISHYNKQFFYYLLENCDLNNIITGSGQPQIVRTPLLNLRILVPPTIVEQKKIAEYLAEMDKLISAQGENVDALKEKKIGLMQQLFPHKGETTPRLRFPGYEGEWVEKKLGDICSVNRGVRVTRKDLTDDGLYPVFQNTDRPLGLYNLSNVEPNNPFVIIGGSAGLIGYCKTKFWAADDCAYFGDADILDKYFLYCTLLLHSAEIKDNVRGGNIPRLERASLERIIMHLPSLAEQQKIAECLSALDDQIAAESAKLEALKDHKKGLMQQLFPQPAN